MSLTRMLYALLRTSNDIRAIRRGPRAMAKRQVRKAMWRTSARIINRTTR